MRRALIAVVLALLVVVHVATLGKAAASRKLLPQADVSAMVLPTPLLRISSLEFKGLAADLLFLDVLVYYGGTLDRTERPFVKDWEWKWFEKGLRAATDLDPYFFDPYYFGNALFSWEARMVREANSLLEKGSSYRTWDWILPFLTGFNYFYFLQENDRAAEQLMEASRRPKANPMLASLASKLAFKERRTETSIQFLEETIRRTDDETIREDLEKRVEALRRIYVLEQAVAIYKQRFQRPPKSLEILVASGILREVPQDPYGGSFSLEKDGSIKSTTDQLLLPAPRRARR
jgi:hypothetical protein